MAITLTVNNVPFSYPGPGAGEVGWNAQATGWANAITNGTLQKTGGNFTLQSDLDFGPNGGLKALYFGSRSATRATNGLIRLANTETIEWRNSTNTADSSLLLDASNRLIYNSPSLSNAFSVTTDGNVGLGGNIANPWGNGYRGLEVANGSGIVSNGSNRIQLTEGFFVNGGGLAIYTTTGNAIGTYSVAQGAHIWQTAPAGTGGTAATLATNMVLNTSGQLGIGTSSPSGLLHVNNATGTTTAFLTSTSTATSDFSEIQITGNNTTGRLSAYGTQHVARPNQFWLSAGTNSNLILSTNNTERARIDTSGNMGVGMTPVFRLDVTGPTGSGIRYTTGSAAGLAAGVDATNSIVQMGSLSNHQLSFLINSSQQMVLTTSGSLGVGTATPNKFPLAKAITINQPTGGSYCGIEFASNDTLVSSLVASNTETRLSSNSTAFMSFYTNNIERGRFTSTGAFTVGQTGGGLSNSNGMTLEPGVGYSVWNHLNGTASTTRYFYFGYNGVEIGNILQNGTAAVQFNTISDRRRKENIVDAPSQEEKLMNIKVREFNFKTEPELTRIGFIAQELNEIVPSAVTAGDDGDEIETPWSVDFSKLVPLLIKQVQELTQRVKELESK